MSTTWLIVDDGARLIGGGLGGNRHVTLVPALVAAAALILAFGVGAADDGLEADEADFPASRAFDGVGHRARMLAPMR